MSIQKVKNLQKESILKLNKQLNSSAMLPEDYQSNRNTYPLVTCVNEIIELFGSENYTAIPNVIEKVEYELKCQSDNKFSKDYLNMVRKYLAVISDFCSIPERLTFYFHGHAVGVLYEVPSNIAKVIHYEPFRGHGHYSLQEELQHKEEVVCELYLSEKPLLITVSQSEKIQYLLIEAVSN